MTPPSSCSSPRCVFGIPTCAFLRFKTALETWRPIYAFHYRNQLGTEGREGRMKGAKRINYSTLSSHCTTMHSIEITPRHTRTLPQLV